MQLSFEGHFDYWITATWFACDQNKELKQSAKKDGLKLFSGLAVLDALVFILIGANTVFWIITFFLVIEILSWFFRTFLSKRQFYRKMHDSYAAKFEQRHDKEVFWELGAEGITIQDYSVKHVVKWRGIRNITVCPDYLFVNYGIMGCAYLPKKVLSESGYHDFYDSLIGMYQQYACEQGNKAEIIQSDWAIDLDDLRKKTSVKRICFTVFWVFIYLLAGLLFFGFITAGVIFYQESTGDLPFEDETIMRVFGRLFIFGSVAMGALGLVLGLLEKLPGTKNSQR